MKLILVQHGSYNLSKLQRNLILNEFVSIRMIDKNIYLILDGIY